MAEDGTPTKEDIDATTAGVQAGASAVSQGLTREQVQDAIEQAIAKHNPPNMSNEDIEKVADVLAKRFEAMGAFEAGPKESSTSAENSTTSVVENSESAPETVQSTSDKVPTPGTFADRFLKEH